MHTLRADSALAAGPWGRSGGPERQRMLTQCPAFFLRSQPIVRRIIANGPACPPLISEWAPLAVW
eukprot:gene12885-biopygen8192